MAETPASPITGSVAHPVLLSDSAAKDVMITWFRGEFAAANAIIDALCGHMIGSGEEYEGVMAAIHRRRLNWIPLLQMQQYHSISQVTLQLQAATAAKIHHKLLTHPQQQLNHDDDSPSSDVTDSGSREEERVEEAMTICWKHEEECEALMEQSKRFSAKEHTNVVKGLKLYEHVFTATQLSKLLDYVNGLREAGRNQELSGDTFVLFNKNTKGTKRELIQLGIPIFGNTTDEHSVAPIPILLQSVIDHLLQWRVIPDYKRPNGCVINFFDEEEHSQPFQKPPHVDQPLSTLVLSESTMVFGHRLGVDNDGNFRGSLTLPLKEGAPLVMLAPAPRRLDAGTGVFLPWTPPVSKKPAKHLPPRVQRLRLLSSAKSVADRESSQPEIGRMRRREDDDSSSSLRPPGICRRLFRFVVAKLGILGEKEEMNEEKRERNKLIKKGSRSDITIHFKQIEDSEEHSKSKNNSPGSSSQESERETVITLANGIKGPKKRLDDKGKRSLLSEPSHKQQITQPEAGKAPQPHRRLRPLLNDINKKSDAFIERTLEKMRKSLA
ncbi:unnamed protein product [Thlaspi arvense]|uniref:Uncharacterized protein n=1 Tax=Thlaspi arvense TaxID=13288 RepID=A0AAU9S7Y6_THLAR|nr:unnamed protein product [Thlaspi arvense]